MNNPVFHWFSACSKVKKNPTKKPKPTKEKKKHVSLLSARAEIIIKDSEYQNFKEGEKGREEEGKERKEKADLDSLQEFRSTLPGIFR